MLNLLQPDTERIVPAAHNPTHDHAPEELALGSPLWLKDDLVTMLGEDQVHSRLIDLVKYATDPARPTGVLAERYECFTITATAD